LKIIIQDDSLRLYLGQKAKALAEEKFSWEREATKYVGALTRLLPAR
jgi:hypothetical protein